ncbi:MAG: glycosyltransferase [Ferruginibacter sp.]|nr:glycosyltransferase [Ferruginibacter sp.]
MRYIKMAKYSIILPVRNGGHYLKTCVASILSQTFTDFNFIILDNCSTDGTLEWLYILNDERIKIIVSEKPLTIEESWGRITSIEKNEFITLIGHDDILYPDFLMVIDRLVINHPQASLYHTHFNFIDAKGKIIRACKPMQQQISGYDFLKKFLTNSIDAMGTGYVMRAKDYDALQGIPVHYPNLLFADFELWLNLSLKSYEVVAAENCFAFRLHKSTTGTSEDKKLHKSLELFTAFLHRMQQEDVKAKHIIDEFGSQFLLLFCKGYSHRLLRTPLKNREGLTVGKFIKFTKELATMLGLQDKFKPEKIPSIKLAAFIDDNKMLSKLFLSFKKIYSKPVSK